MFNLCFRNKQSIQIADDYLPLNNTSVIGKFTSKQNDYLLLIAH